MTEPTEIILIVEDSPTYAATLKRKIAQRLPFQVIVAGTLAEAGDIIAAHRDKIFMAVLDLDLPDAPRGEVVDYALEQNISSLVLSGSFSDRTRERMVARNIVDYVTKDGRQDVDYVVHLIRRIHANQDTKVLVVDDSRTARHVMKSYLVTQRFQVLEADDGVNALKVLEAHPDVRLVVTDNQMPEMDGYELIAHIRDKYPQHQMGIIGVSAQGGSVMSSMFLKGGANDFLTKPFSKEEFVCRINQNVDLLEMFQEIKETSNRDYLTNLYNRRYFFEVGQRYLENALRNNLTLTVAMLDIDHFKVINDTYGHEAGDVVIKRIAALLDEDVRKTDILARLGGEEFCVLAVNMKRTDAAQVFKRICASIEAEEIPYEGNLLQVSISIGVTTNRSNSLADIVQQADEMLYRAKDGGRNRVEIASETGG